MIGSHPVKVITAYNQNEEATGEQGADQSRSIYANYTNTDLYKALKPFLTNLQLVGLHHKKEYQLDKCISKDSGQRKCRLALTPSQVYSFIISLLVTLNTFRYFYTFKDDNSFGTTLLDKLLYIGWNLLCTTKILACFRASHKYTCLPEFFLEWEKIHANDKDCVNLKFCRRSAYIYSITCWTLVTVNVGVSVYAIYFTDAYDSWLTPFSKKDSFIHYWYIYQIIITFYSNTVWIFPMALQYMICKILYVEFKRFNKCFKKRLVENGCEMLEEFEDMRQKHQSLCKLVNHADDFLSLYNGGVVAFALLGICINLYNLIWYEEVRQDFFAVFVPLFWLTAITVELGFVCIGGILINTKVGLLSLILMPKQ